MKFSSHILAKTYILICAAAWGSTWQYFTSLSDLSLYNSPEETKHVHSEYIFGHCKDKTKIFYAHHHLDHVDVLGKVIVRGWIDVMRIPTCIVLRAMSFHVDLVRSSSYRFQMCVPRITYCHTHHRYKYYYFELYVPDDMIGGMDWDIYFFGSPNMEWQ